MDGIKKIKKAYYFIIMLVIIIFVLASFYLYWKKNHPTSSIPVINQANPIADNQASPGNAFNLDDIKNKSRILYDSNLGKGYLLEENKNYKIIMFEKDEISFLISLDALENITSIRTEAEEKFLNFTGMDKDLACQQKVSLSVPKEASKTQIGVDYGLSFCPNGIPFEP